MGTPELSEVCLARLHEFSERPRRRVHVRTDSVSSLLSLRLPGHGHDPSGPGCARHWVTSFAGGLHGTRTRDPGASLSSVGTLPSRFEIGFCVDTRRRLVMRRYPVASCSD